VSSIANRRKLIRNELTLTRFLDIALVCEHRGDLKMAEGAGTRAMQIKKDCQGTDFPNYDRYADSLHRIKMKLALADAQRRA